MKKMKRLWSLVLSAAMVCTTLLGGTSALAQEGDASDEVTVKVVHTNDIHGRSGYQEGTVFGFEKLATLIQLEDPDLVLDAGDLFHGQAFATLEEGESIAELVKAVGYDAMTPGNHDWNYGKDRLKELGDVAGLPILAGNITQDGENFFGGDGTFIKTVDGVKIGVLSVFDPDIKDDTAPRNVEGLTFSDDAQTATQLAEKLRQEGCDIVIALSHQLYCDEFIAQTKGIDVMIAGHEHVVLDESYPDADGKPVKVVEAGCYFENVGILSITYDPSEDAVVSMEEEVISASQAGDIASDETVSVLLGEIQERQAAQLTQVVGSTGRDLDGRWEELRVEETGLGRLVTAAYLEETGADIAFENAGGIRLGRMLPAGDITCQDIIDISPFGNYIVTKQITGEAVLSILEKSIDIGIRNQESYDQWKETGSDQVRWPDDNGSYLQFGGMKVTYDTSKPMGQRVLSVQVGEQPLELDRVYIVATNNYISLGKAFSELADVPELHQYAACDEALIRFVQQGQEKVDTAAANESLQDVTGIPEEPSESQTESQPSASSSTASSSTGSGIDSPNTGVESFAWVWGLLAVSLVGMALGAARSKKAEK
ncbi:Trifunctional nucleotide phosphoesterase protein YfkN precursor [Eubacteriaceae bacterium CHKCI005]|nr:Trifunctional nucleotide phosphoesterase protein YfkN precursor [Eubacteriaceae bacterium CHKCI005]